MQDRRVGDRQALRHVQEGALVTHRGDVCVQEGALVTDELSCACKTRALVTDKSFGTRKTRALVTDEIGCYGEAAKAGNVMPTLRRASWVCSNCCGLGGVGQSVASSSGVNSVGPSKTRAVTASMIA